MTQTRAGNQPLDLECSTQTISKDDLTGGGGAGVNQKMNNDCKYFSGATDFNLVQIATFWGNATLILQTKVQATLL